VGKSQMRLLAPELIPDSLYDKVRQILRLPEMLACIYRAMIVSHGLIPLSRSRDPKNPPIGGINKAQTDQHFAQAFDGSVARTQLALLDPKSDVSSASNAFIKALSGNKICIADAPCGAGASVMSLLATIAELRLKSVLPRQPLDINIVGAEISEYARAYAQEIFQKMQGPLSEQGININAQFMSWDVTDQLSNTALIRQITLSSAGSNKTLLVIANFNGFLSQGGKQKKADPQLSELFRHVSLTESVAIWIEPAMNAAVSEGGLLHRIKNIVQNIMKPWAAVSVNVDSSIPTTSLKYYHPLEQSEIINVRLALLRINLGRYA